MALDPVFFLLCRCVQTSAIHVSSLYHCTSYTPFQFIFSIDLLLLFLLFINLAISNPTPEILSLIGKRLYLTLDYIKVHA